VHVLVFYPLLWRLFLAEGLKLQYYIVLTIVKSLGTYCKATGITQLVDRWQCNINTPMYVYPYSS